MKKQFEHSDQATFVTTSMKIKVIPPPPCTFHVAYDRCREYLKIHMWIMYDSYTIQIQRHYATYATYSAYACACACTCVCVCVLVCVRACMRVFVCVTLTSYCCVISIMTWISRDSFIQCISRLSSTTINYTNLHCTHCILTINALSS